MSPIYLNPQSSSPIPFLDMKGDQQHSFQVFGYLHDDHLGASNNNNNTNTSSFSYHTYDHEVLSLDSSRHKQENKVEKLVLSQEMKASDLRRPCSSWLQTRLRDENGCNTYAYSINLEEEQKNNESVNYDDQKYSRKWKPSKVRIMQKMMGKSKNSRDQITNNNSKQQIVDHDHLAKRQTSDGVRVCTDCHTTTTPLWRSGPQGPKSLCNACGIRQRKARRAAMAAAAAAGFSSDTMVTSTEPPVQSPKPNKVETIMKTQKGIDNLDKTHTLPLKKRTKIINANKNNYTHNYSYNNNNNNSKKICFEDFALSSNKDYINPNPKKSFPRDEEEGAILLMALSCGLACSSY